MSNFNATIGKGGEGDFIVNFALGSRNERRETVVQLYQENELIVTNTYYWLPERRLYTSKAPGDNSGNVIRNRVDFILINNQYRNSIKALKTYPGADIKSDHNPLVAKF